MAFTTSCPSHFCELNQESKNVDYETPSTRDKNLMARKLNADAHLHPINFTMTILNIYVIETFFFSFFKFFFYNLTGRMGKNNEKE